MDDETESKVGTEEEVLSGAVNSQPVADRRNLFRRLMALAGLGLTGALLSQGTAGVVPAVAATDVGVTTDTSSTNYNNLLAVFDKSTGTSISSTTNTSTGDNMGWDPSTAKVSISSHGSPALDVAGIGSNGIVIRALSQDKSNKAIVAAGYVNQAANLQEWQDDVLNPLSVVDPYGHFGIGTAGPDKMLTLYNGISSGDNVELRLANANANVGDTQLIGFGDAPGGTIDYVEAGAVIDAGASMAFIVKTKNTNNKSTPPTERLRITGAGNVGIGTTSPATMLHIFNQHAATEGNALIMDTPLAAQQALLGFWDHGTQKWQFGKNTDNSFTIWDQVGTKELMHGSSNGNLFLMPASGTVGIGTYSPSSSYKLDVAGSVHATSFPTSSDMRFKEDIAPIDNALEKVLQLQGVYFKWNKLHRETLKRSSNLTSRQVGLIAQQVREVLPEVVSEWADQGADDYLAVDYSRLVAITIEAMKEQQSTIEAMKEQFRLELEALRSEIRELKRTGIS